MLPVITDRNSQIRNILIRIISVSSDSDNGIFSVFLNHGNKGEFAVIIDVSELPDHVFRKGVERLRNRK